MLAYTRKFIILKKEFSTIKGINPKGHCKLEIKGIRGIITVNIENAHKDSAYNVVFISKDKANSRWNLGKIFTDEIGKGKSESIFILRELEAKNFSMDTVSAILIMKEEDVLLGGYLNDEDGSIERYIEWISMERKPTVEDIPIEDIPIEDKPKIEEPITVEEIYVEEIPVVEQIIEEPIIEESIMEEPIIEMPQIQDLEPIIEDVGEDYEDESMEPDLRTIEHMKKINQKNQTINYVLSILRFFPYIDPFKRNLLGYNWWTVDIDSDNEYRAFLPYFSYIVGGNNKEPHTNVTTCNQLMNKYGHYLFGIYNEGESVKYFIYGIPGEFIQDEHPFKGANGFNTWYEGLGDHGYWIIYIDPMTGKPVEIPIPMVPQD